jgi:anti-sigma regulatory factor (Ser/Thr protein kinase)
LTSNTLQHTSGGGHVRVWAEGGQVILAVADGGPPRSFGEMPPADSPRGRGLAIVNSIADEVSSDSGPDGTVVQVRMNL